NTQEGETVEVGTVIAVIGDSAEGGVQSPKSKVQSQTDTPIAEVASEDVTDKTLPAAIPNPKSEVQNPKSSEAIEVVMPQMGESITEGTVSKWLKSIGNKINKDEA